MSMGDFFLLGHFQVNAYTEKSDLLQEELKTAKRNQTVLMNEQFIVEKSEIYFSLHNFSLR